MPVSLLLEDALRAPGVMIYPGKFYVYEWRDVAGTCLYIGCGKDGRAWQIRREPSNRSNRYCPPLPPCRGLREVCVTILVWTESRKDALRYEKDMIVRRRPTWNIRGADFNWNPEYR